MKKSFLYKTCLLRLKKKKTEKYFHSLDYLTSTMNPDTLSNMANDEPLDEQELSVEDENANINENEIEERNPKASATLIEIPTEKRLSREVAGEEDVTPDLSLNYKDY